MSNAGLKARSALDELEFLHAHRALRLGGEQLGELPVAFLRGRGHGMARALLLLGRASLKITMIRFHLDASPESRGRISMAVDKIRIAPDRRFAPAG